MMEFERRCWAEVDLGALRHNFKLVRERAGDAAVMAVVKADAYGHGDAVVAPLLEQEGADQFAVSGFGEAVCLRRAGVTKPILILGYTGVQNAAALAVGGISQTVFSLEYARALSEAALRAGVAVRVHLKVDTGMGRIGFTADDEDDKGIFGFFKKKRNELEAMKASYSKACARGCLYAFRSGGQHRAGGYRLYAPPVRYFVRGSGGDGRPGLYLCGEALLQFGGYLRLAGVPSGHGAAGHHPVRRTALG